MGYTYLPVIPILSVCVLNGYLFIFETERVSRRGAEREGEKENPKEAPFCQCRARCRA